MEMESLGEKENSIIRKREGLALSLSGGGYRATLFHLGLLRRLNELDLLRAVDAISSVSGGSITSAILAKTAHRWKNGRLGEEEWNSLIRDPLIEFTGRNIRTLPILVSALKFWKKGIAVQETEKLYHKHLTKQTLGELPDDVDFIFCASDMVFSTHWYFRKKTTASKRTGNHRAGRLREWKSIPVARAVAASSCFPPVFGPMVMGKTEDDFVKPGNSGGNWSELVKDIRLTDGGVYDNLGVEPVWNEYRTLIVSDGGKPSPFRPVGKTGQTFRLPGLFLEQIEDLRKRMLFERINSRSLDFNGTIVSISSGDKPNGYSRAFAGEVISNIRTDLDSFSEIEAKVLENHGYALADANIKKYIVDELAPIPYDAGALSSPEIPNPEAVNENELRKRLRNSSKRPLLYKWRIL